MKALSTYIDSLSGEKISTYLSSAVPMTVNGLSPYPDFLALGATLLFASKNHNFDIFFSNKRNCTSTISAALAFGAKESTIINNVFTICNLGVVLFVVVAGSILASPENWSIPEEGVPTNRTDYDGGSGGFAPFGVGGIIRGAAICFYGFIGFVVRFS